MSCFSKAKVGAISIIQSIEPSSFFGTVIPADSSQSAERATIISFAVSMLSVPAAFFTGANSSLRRVCKIFVKADVADAVLAAMHKNEFGKKASIIGEVVNDHIGKVAMKTPLGINRIVDMPIGDQLPRIC